MSDSVAAILTIMYMTLYNGVIFICLCLPFVFLGMAFNFIRGRFGL